MSKREERRQRMKVVYEEAVKALRAYAQNAIDTIKANTLNESPIPHPKTWLIRAAAAYMTMLKQQKKYEVGGMQQRIDLAIATFPTESKEIWEELAKLVSEKNKELGIVEEVKPEDPYQKMRDQLNKERERKPRAFDTSG